MAMVGLHVCCDLDQLRILQNETRARLRQYSTSPNPQFIDYILIARFVSRWGYRQRDCADAGLA